ncbi:hypothetical protein [Clostridium estertheticum]|nr:hypothetical protein [Clostridium estertheticum]
MVLFIYEEGGENYMDNKNEFVISKDVIDECLAESVEKTTK